MEPSIDTVKPTKIEVRHWKSNDVATYTQEDQIWTIVTHRKEKADSDDVKEVKVKIPHMNVVTLYKILKTIQTPDNNIHTKVVWQHLINHYALDVTLDAFYGGRNRSRIYFPLYYYPCKVLEHLQKIKYSGHGIISLLETTDDISQADR